MTRANLSYRNLNVMHAYGIVSAVTFTKDNLGIRNAFMYIYTYSYIRDF